MRGTPSPTGGAVVGLFVVVVWSVLGACTSGLTSAPEATDPEGPDRPAVAPIDPVGTTPFCRAMTDLADRLENDPPDDVAAAIIEVYEDVLDVAPDVVRPDLMAVLAALRGEPPTVTSTVASPATTPGSSLPEGDPLPDEGWRPDDTPAGRLNAYVEFECRAVVNNPGPPPTQPLDEPTGT